MKRTRAEAVIEAVLFTMGESVEISRLADVIEEDVKVVKEILKGMEERYAREDRGITLAYFENAVQLCTKEEMYEYLVKIAKTPKKMSLEECLEFIADDELLEITPKNIRIRKRILDSELRAKANAKIKKGLA